MPELLILPVVTNPLANISAVNCSTGIFLGVTLIVTSPPIPFIALLLISLVLMLL